MRARLGLLFPVALLGCQMRPWTPSVSVAFWAEDVPGSQDTKLPTGLELAQRWQLPPGSQWANYYKGTLVSAVDPMGGYAQLPAVNELDVIETARAAASNVAKTGLPSGTMWLLDLRGAASCAFAATLSREAKEPVAPVLTFNNWPASMSLVPAEETLAGLVVYPPKPLDAANAANASPVFLLDSWRLAYRFDEPEVGVYDNRYMLTASDFPSVEVLRERGITKVVYVVEDLDDAEVEEDDLYESFRAWQEAGIAIFFVDLDFLKETKIGLGERTDWTARLMPNAYWSRERWTLVDDPIFYGRARGGFGLYYGRPFISPGYHGWGYSTGGGGRSHGSGG